MSAILPNPRRELMMAMQRDPPMGRQYWMQWCPRHQLAQLRPPRIAGNRSAGLDQVCGVTCLVARLRRLTVHSAAMIWPS
jgi:hypothetical protein